MSVGATSEHQDSPVVSIIVPVYGYPFYTRLFLATVTQSLADDEAVPAYEVILVDNATSNEIGGLLRATTIPNHRVVRLNDAVSFAAACNEGARQARGAWLIFLNNDTVPLAGWLSALLAEATAHERAIVGPKLLYPDERIQHAGIGFGPGGWPLLLHHGQPADWPEANRATSPRAVTGAALLIARDHFWQLGGFDEGYCNGFEDLDLCCLARARGATIRYAPASVLYHFGSVSPGRFTADEANQERFITRWGASLDQECDQFASVESAAMQDWHAAATAKFNGDIAPLLARLGAARSRFVGQEDLFSDLQQLCWNYRDLTRRLEELIADQARISVDFAAQAVWAQNLEATLVAQTAWAQDLEHQLATPERGGLRVVLRRRRSHAGKNEASRTGHSPDGRG